MTWLRARLRPGWRFGRTAGFSRTCFGHWSRRTSRLEHLRSRWRRRGRSVARGRAMAQTRMQAAKRQARPLDQDRGGDRPTRLSPTSRARYSGTSGFGPSTGRMRRSQPASRPEPAWAAVADDRPAARWPRLAACPRADSDLCWRGRPLAAARPYSRCASCRFDIGGLAQGLSVKIWWHEATSAQVDFRLQDRYARTPARAHQPRRYSKILGHRVGIGGQTAADKAPACPAGDDCTQSRISVHQLAGELALFDLLANILGVLVLEVPVQMPPARCGGLVAWSGIQSRCSNRLRAESQRAGQRCAAVSPMQVIVRGRRQFRAKFRYPAARRRCGARIRQRDPDAAPGSARSAPATQRPSRGPRRAGPTPRVHRRGSRTGRRSSRAPRAWRRPRPRPAPPVRGLRAGLVRRAPADDGATADERQAVGSDRGLQRDRHLRRVVPVHRADDVPAVGLEARGRVVRAPALHVAVDGDAVVVEDRDEPAELERARERGGLVRDAFHQAAVAEEHPGAVVHDLVAGPVVARRELLARRAPCPRRWRSPGPAGPWSSRCRAAGRAPDARRCATRAGGTPSGLRAVNG